MIIMSMGIRLFQGNGHGFFSHQLGSFLGVWLGGRVYDSTGSYSIVWIRAIVLGLMAGIVHLPIKDKPIKLTAS